MEIPVGLKVRSGKILEFIASTAVGIAIVGGGALGILYDDVLFGVIVYCFTGLLVGLAFSRGFEKDFILGNLYRIARARCLIRLDRQAEASYILKIFVHHPDYPPFSITPVIKYLVYASIDLIDDFPKEAGKYLNEAAKSVSSGDKHREVYLDSIQKTRRLTYLEDDLESVKKTEPSAPHTIQYSGIGCVLDTGYDYMKGVDPSEYDPDNSTGWMTGQWIDVKVLEGKVCFNKWYGPGEIIRGVWSYGGDVGIVGKPKVGDLVGYYEEGYCKILEKIQGK